MQPDPTPTCDRCPKPSAGVCCSSHGKELCHEDYRLTHFVEVCGCRQCDTEGLPRILPRSQPKPSRAPARTWTMPRPASDVRAVRDAQGVTWTRGGTEDHLWEAPDVPKSRTFALLLDERGPLTEVTDDHA